MYQLYATQPNTGQTLKWEATTQKKKHTWLELKALKSTSGGAGASQNPASAAGKSFVSDGSLCQIPGKQDNHHKSCQDISMEAKIPQNWESRVEWRTHRKILFSNTFSFSIPFNVYLMQSVFLSSLSFEEISSWGNCDRPHTLTRENISRVHKRRPIFTTHRPVVDWVEKHT